MSHRSKSLTLAVLVVVSFAVNLSPRDAAAQPGTDTAPPPPAPAPAPAPTPPLQPQQPYYYPPPQPYYYPPQPPQPPVDSDPMGSAKAKLEVIGDFAGLGMLAGFTVVDARDLGGSDSGVMMVLGSTVGGAATGWLLAERLKPTSGEANSTTLGLTLGAANGLLLLEPLALADTSEEALPFILLTTTAGTVGGLVLGQKMSLTRGQATFAANLAMLGVGTTALAAALGDQDEEFGGGESAALAVGLDAGAVAGLVLAPKIDWAPNRARFVFAGTMVGAFLGGMVGSILASEKNDETGEKELDPDAVSASLLVGMWGGFLASAQLTSGWSPDTKYARPAAAPIAIAPRVGNGQLGIAISGGF